MKKIIRKIIRRIFRPSVIGTGNIIVNPTRWKIKKTIIGNNNSVTIGEGCMLKDIWFWIEGDNNHISIGKNTTVEQAQIACAGFADQRVVLGEDCMLSSGIRIVNSDSHSIISLETGKRINPEADVFIGDHVWIGANVTVLKGVTIGKNSVVAANSVVTHDVPENTIVGGIPAKVIKNNITWDRERI